MKTLSRRLRKYGLRYDDLYDPYYDLDVKEALNRLPREIVDARHQRIKRAMDLSMKHEYLPENLQAMQTPFRGYLKDMLALVRRSFPASRGTPIGWHCQPENANLHSVGVLQALDGTRFRNLKDLIILYMKKPYRTQSRTTTAIDTFDL
ncbi:hypothetical protein CRG98_035213 [Punica granatum]|uniref:Complex III subunit VII n=1 Tax=Punica granatum TaxID=22663 RepID=A0A2I0IK60_PUNGR|nr:hypothetical protein CRG98_035213 [Punica granatum]